MCRELRTSGDARLGRILRAVPQVMSRCGDIPSLTCITVTATASCRTSGKEVASPPPPPLRTVQAPFDAYGSSIGQRTYDGTRLPALALGTTCTLLSRSQQRNRRKPHQQERCAPPTFLHCLLKSVCLTFHVRQHQREVCQLSPRGDVARGLNPYPTHYRSAFACSLLLYPPPHRRLLRGRLPSDNELSVGATTGLPRSAAVTVWVRSRLFAGGATTAPEEFGASGPDHVPFGPSVSASYACPL